MTPTKLDQSGLGSLDWAGATAPSGGVHTGQTRITMVDGSSFLVAHSLAEVRTKMGVLNGSPPWVAFDVAGSLAGSVVLDASQIFAPARIRVSPTPNLDPSAQLHPGAFLP